jgi:hypothetical protein
LVRGWAWHPGGGPLLGLPRDAAEAVAVARRQERIPIVIGDGEPAASGHWSKPHPFMIDLRGE